MTRSRIHATALKLTTVAAAGALLAAPASGVAAKPVAKKKPASAGAKSCAKVHNVAYMVSGKLVSVTADDAMTPANEATVTFTVTNANKHARRSGDIADQDAVKKGVQVKGAGYTVPATDAGGFKLRLNGFEGTDTPSPGDRVHVTGRIPLTKKRCAPAGTTLADRYGAVDVKRVSIGDRDAD